jgi:hypothetical protein
MSLGLLKEFWYNVYEYIDNDSREDIIQGLIVLLTEHGYDLDEIADEFESDKEIMRQVKMARDEIDEYEDNSDDNDYYSDDESDDY